MELLGHKDLLPEVQAVADEAGTPDPLPVEQLAGQTVLVVDDVDHHAGDAQGADRRCDQKGGEALVGTDEQPVQLWQQIERSNGHRADRPWGQVAALPEDKPGLLVDLSEQAAGHHGVQPAVDHVVLVAPEGGPQEVEEQADERHRQHQAQGRAEQKSAGVQCHQQQRPEEIEDLFDAERPGVLQEVSVGIWYQGPEIESRDGKAPGFLGNPVNRPQDADDGEV